MKPQVKLSVECPHCKETIVRETQNYHSIIHGPYFHKDEVIPFETIKEKVKSGEWEYSLLHDAYSWSQYFTCDHCNSHVSIVEEEGSFRGDRFKETWRFKVKKAGNRLDRKFLDRFFNKLDTFSRNAPDDYEVTGNRKCRKQIFVEKVWALIKKDIIKKPWVVKTDTYKGIVYIGGMEYVLGYSEEVRLYCYDMTGSLIDIKLDQFNSSRLEWLPFEDEVAKKVYAAIFSM
jgi:hypothetical protein